MLWLSPCAHAAGHASALALTGPADAHSALAAQPSQRSQQQPKRAHCSACRLPASDRPSRRMQRTSGRSTAARSHLCVHVPRKQVLALTSPSTAHSAPGGAWQRPLWTAAGQTLQPSRASLPAAPPSRWACWVRWSHWPRWACTRRSVTRTHQWLDDSCAGQLLAGLCAGAVLSGHSTLRRQRLAANASCTPVLLGGVFAWNHPDHPLSPWRWSRCWCWRSLGSGAGPGLSRHSAFRQQRLGGQAPQRGHHLARHAHGVLRQAARYGQQRADAGRRVLPELLRRQPAHTGQCQRPAA